MNKRKWVSDYVSGQRSSLKNEGGRGLNVISRERLKVKGKKLEIKGQRSKIQGQRSK
jgi:hypothetical protein